MKKKFNTQNKETTSFIEDAFVLDNSLFVNLKEDLLFKNNTVSDLLGFLCLISHNQKIKFKISRDGILFENKKECERIIKILSDSINYN